MMKLSKQQRDRLILIAIGTFGVIAIIWFGLIGPQRTSLEVKKTKIATAEDKVAKASQLIRRSEQIQQDLESKQARLAAIEASMASGDLYSWVILTLNKFQVPFNVSISNYSRELVGVIGIFPVFPYAAASFTVNGTAYYHDFGRFLAEFENTFPYFRVQNLDLNPASGANNEPSEKLEFRMEVVALINKPPAAK